MLELRDGALVGTCQRRYPTVTRLSSDNRETRLVYCVIVGCKTMIVVIGRKTLQTAVS